jgi:mono/diheme cytochrome c family protein
MHKIDRNVRLDNSSFRACRSDALHRYNRLDAGRSVTWGRRRVGVRSLSGSGVRGLILSLGVLTLAAARGVLAAQPVGHDLYAQRCAACHDNATGRTPARDVLRILPPESIVTSLTNGAMIFQASGLRREEILALAGYVSEKPFGTPLAAQTRPNPCARAARPLKLDSLTSRYLWNGWGRDPENSRYQPHPGLKASDVPRLKVKWAYAYAGRFAYGQPTVIGDRLFVTNSLGGIRRERAIALRTAVRISTSAHRPFCGGSRTDDASSSPARSRVWSTVSIPTITAGFGGRSASATAVRSAASNGAWLPTTNMLTSRTPTSACEKARCPD